MSSILAGGATNARCKPFFGFAADFSFSYNTQVLSDSISERLLFYKFTKLFSAMIILLSNGSYISLEIYFYL